MKKVLTAMTLALSSIMAQAATQTVEVVWPFAIGGTQANMIRHLLDSANSSQKKYNFVLTNKPGAGGVIATRSVLESPNLTVLAQGATFYVRPLLYKDSYDVDKFNMLNQICEYSPFGWFSKKYKSLEEMRGKEITVGIIPGSAGNIFSVALAKTYKDIKIVEVPYKDTVAASTDMLGQHVDTSIDLMSKGTLERMTPDVKIVAVSGKEKYPGAATAPSLASVAAGHFFFIPKTVSKETQEELNKIFTSAINKKFKDACADEKGTIEPVPFEKLDELHENYKKSWKSLTAGMKVE